MLCALHTAITLPGSLLQEVWQVVLWYKALMGVILKHVENSAVTPTWHHHHVSTSQQTMRLGSSTTHNLPNIILESKQACAPVERA